MTLMVQDLTNPMLAQVPHVLLAAHAGTIMGVETNAMQFYPAASPRSGASSRPLHPAPGHPRPLYCTRGRIRLRRRAAPPLTPEPSDPRRGVSSPAEGGRHGDARWDGRARRCR